MDTEEFYSKLLVSNNWPDRRQAIGDLIVSGVESPLTEWTSGKAFAEDVLRAFPGVDLEVDPRDLVRYWEEEIASQTEDES